MRTWGISLAAAFLALLGACETSAGGPFLEAPFLTEDDLTLLTPQLYVPQPIAHPVNDSVGWGYLQVYESASQLNAWTLNPFRRLSPLIDQARTDTGVPVEPGTRWGPYPDPWDNPLEWMVWSDGSAVELQVRPEGSDADYAAFWSVEFTESGDGVESPRAATLRFDADLIAVMPDLGSHLHDEIRMYAGQMTFDLARGPGLGHRVDVHWQDFGAVGTGLGSVSVVPGSELNYLREVDGRGSFVFALVGPYDDDIGFTGPAQDIARFEAQWFASSAGFSRMRVAEDGPDNPGGDPLYGALEIQECFDDEGELMWRDIRDPYLEVQAEYEKGELSLCEGALPWPPVDG